MAETSINRNWLAKMVLFIAAFIGLGVWGLIDALVVYPARGATYAAYAEFQYLRSLEATGEILRASVDDPQSTLEELQGRRTEIKNEIDALPPESLARARAAAQAARLGWLEALDTIGRATPSHTTYEDPNVRLDELRDKWASAEQPKPLSGLDIPTQWVFFGVGLLGSAWMGLTVMKVLKTKYRYEESSHTLTLPSGESFTPQQIVELDKRKWDKFFVTIKLEDGSTHKLDLLRYQPLEEWILEMEKLSPNYEPPEEDETPENALAEGDAPDAVDESESETPPSA